MILDVALHHRSLYDYDRRVRTGPRVISLRPEPAGRPAFPSTPDLRRVARKDGS
jgi:hypothetical protein